jgi:hypothetical protein
MDGYSGFEPQIGEILALRTFRIGVGGVLFPVFGNAPWMPAVNTATCRLNTSCDDSGGHRAPEPGCSCGFYAFGSEEGTAEYPQATHVLAVVACWGRIIAGTRGIRAEHCCVRALWMSPTVPPDLAAEVATRYESTEIFSERAEMLRQHCPTALDCYEPPGPKLDGLHRFGLRLLVTTALILGLLPAAVLAADQLAHWAWITEVAALIVGAFVLRKRRFDLGSKRLMLLFLSLLLWLAAPFAGVAGIVLLRLPMAQIVAFTLVQRWLIVRAAARFPSRIE